VRAQTSEPPPGAGTDPLARSGVGPPALDSLRDLRGEHMFATVCVRIWAHVRGVAAGCRI